MLTVSVHATPASFQMLAVFVHVAPAKFQMLDVSLHATPAIFQMLAVSLHATPATFQMLAVSLRAIQCSIWLTRGSKGAFHKMKCCTIFCTRQSNLMRLEGLLIPNGKVSVSLKCKHVGYYLGSGSRQETITEHFTNKS